MSRTEFLVPMQIRKNGGVINDTLDAGGTADFYKAMLVRKTNAGTVKSIPAAPGTSGAVTSASGADKGIYGITLEDFDYSEDGANHAIATQKIEADTVLYMQMCASSTGDATAAQATIGDRFGLYWDKDTKVLAVDVDETTNVVVEVVDVEPSVYPFDPKSTEEYNMVFVKVLPALLEVAPEA